MMQSNAYFPQCFNSPALYLKQVYVAYHYPVLFSCCSDDGKIYMATCYYADGEKKECLIVETNPQTIVAMLENRKTIRDVFDEGNETYLATWNADGSYFCRKASSEKIPQEILPTKGYYMESEPDEFAEEIEELKELCQYRQFNVIQNYDVTIKHFRFNRLESADLWANSMITLLKNEPAYSVSSCSERVIAI